jgi:hypothetical protein
VSLDFDTILWFFTMHCIVFTHLFIGLEAKFKRDKFFYSPTFIVLAIFISTLVVFFVFHEGKSPLYASEIVLASLGGLGSCQTVHYWGGLSPRCKIASVASASLLVGLSALGLLIKIVEVDPTVITSRQPISSYQRIGL